MEGRIKQDLKEAQLVRDGLRVSTLRLLISEMNNAKIQKGGELNDDELTAVIRREAKKRTEAAAGFRSGGREEPALKEEAELAILKSYLPQELSNEELTKLVEGSINELNAHSLADMGRVIGAVMGKAGGRADRGRVSVLVKENLEEKF